MINWSNTLDKISRYFQVHEGLFLPRWNRLANESDGLTEDSKTGLMSLFQKLDQVRDLLGVPIIVHCGFRPPKYNLLVCGAENSAHIARMILVDGKKYYIAAVDFHPLFSGLEIGAQCDKGKKMIESELESLGLRMEQNGEGAPWIHLDSRPVPSGGDRVFKS